MSKLQVMHDSINQKHYAKRYSKILYESDNGSNASTIELSDSVEKYDYVEIVFRERNVIGNTMRIDAKNYNNFTLFNIFPENSVLYINACKARLTNNEYKKIETGRLYTNSGSINVYNNSLEFKIHKIIGYKD